VTGGTMAVAERSGGADRPSVLRLVVTFDEMPADADDGDAGDFSETYMGHVSTAYMRGSWHGDR
jgi:hypothetical protein